MAMDPKRVVAIEWAILALLAIGVVVIFVINALRPPGPERGQYPVLEKRIKQYQDSGKRL